MACRQLRTCGSSVADAAEVDQSRRQKAPLSKIGEAVRLACYAAHKLHVLEAVHMYEEQHTEHHRRDSLTYSYISYGLLYHWYALTVLHDDSSHACSSATPCA